MPKTVLMPGSVAPGRDPYSSLVEAHGLVFVAGQVGRPLDAPDLDFADEARATFDRIGKLLRGVGLDLGDVVRCTVYLTDFDDFPALNEIFADTFPSEPPTRSTVAVSRLARDCRIEVEATAAR